MASGWKRDLIHMVGCCWAAQVGPLKNEAWWVAIEKFISIMVQQKKEWMEVKELTPLKYMPYVAKLFHEVTGKDLRGLGEFTGWIGLGGYYHCRVVQQVLIHLVPCLQNEPRPMTPKAHLSGQPLPQRPAQPVPQPQELRRDHRVELNQLLREVGKDPPQAREVDKDPPRPREVDKGPPRVKGKVRPLQTRGGASTPHQGGRPTAPSQGGRSSAPSQSTTPTTSGDPTDQPSGDQGAGDFASWYHLTM